MSFHGFQSSAVTPFQVDQFGESITFHCDGGDVEIVTPVDIDPVQTGGGPAVQTGTIRFPTSEQGELDVYPGPVLTATIRGQLWHILEPGPAVDGLQEMPIRLHQSETTRAGVFDLNDEQAGWGP